MTIPNRPRPPERLGKCGDVRLNHKDKCTVNLGRTPPVVSVGSRVKRVRRTRFLWRLYIIDFQYLTNATWWLDTLLPLGWGQTSAQQLVYSLSTWRIIARRLEVPGSFVDQWVKLWSWSAWSMDPPRIAESDLRHRLHLDDRKNWISDWCGLCHFNFA